MFECDSVHLQSASTKRASVPNLRDSRRVRQRACFFWGNEAPRLVNICAADRQLKKFRSYRFIPSRVEPSLNLLATVFPCILQIPQQSPPHTHTHRRHSLSLLCLLFHFSRSAAVFHSSRRSLSLLSVSSCHRLLLAALLGSFFPLRPSFSCSLTRPSVVLFIIRRRGARSHSAPLSDPPLPPTLVFTCLFDLRRLCVNRTSAHFDGWPQEKSFQRSARHPARAQGSQTQELDQFYI